MMPKPPKITSYSKDTQTLLDSMMSQSGLPQAEQRRLRQACAAGPSARLAPPRRRPAGAASAAPRPYEDLLQGVPINPAMNLPGSHRRTQAQIVAEHGGSMDRPQSRGGPRPVDRAKQTLALQQQMEFGRVLPEPGGKGAAAAAPPRLPPQRRPEAELRDKVVAEIDERSQFLHAMHAAGRTEHDEAIKAQIAERLHDLERIDKLASDE